MALAEVIDSRSSGSRDRSRRRGTGTTGWTALALVIAAIVSIPILVVLASAFLPATEVWGHLVSTVLGRYITNTLWILLGVAALTLVMGAGTAWLVSMCAFPGRRVFEWALLLPLAMPAYAIAFTYGGMLDFAGPVQSGLRELFGWGAGDYWFPDVRSLAGVILLMGLVLYPYVYLLARTAFLEQSVCVLEVGRNVGPGAMAHLSPHRATVGAAGHCRRDGSGVDGGLERIRGDAVFGRGHLHHRHFPHLAKSRGPRRRGPTGRRADAVHLCLTGHRARFPGPGRVSPHHHQVPASAALPLDRLAWRWRVGRVFGADCAGVPGARRATGTMVRRHGTEDNRRPLFFARPPTPSAFPRWLQSSP